MKKPSFLMCRPTFYGIDYEINPWMDVRRQADRALALKQWMELRRALQERIGAVVRLCRAEPALPDMAFTANAGLVRGRAAILSRFRYRERSGEEPHFRSWFRRHGYRVVILPEGHRYEGAGDALFLGDVLFAGYWFRSDIQTHQLAGETFGVRTVSLELVNERFYHLDTCFCPINSSSAIYYPGAFDRYSRRVLRENVPDLLAVTSEEAHRFACNSIVVGRKTIIPTHCPKLANALRARGLRVNELDLSEFIKAGGAAKCLTLRLD